MHIKLLALTWAFLVSVVLCDGGIQSLFNVKTDSNTKGGCKSRFPTALNKLVSESKTLVASALKVFDDAQDSSAAEHDVAVRYLRTYFYVTTEASDTVNFNFVKSNLEKVQNFLNGNSQNKVPYLFCGDKWLEKLQRTDEVWDANRDPIMVGYENEYESEGGVGHPISISDVEAYAKYLFTDPDTRKEPNNRTPYWSDDLKEYVFDEDYGKKTYCTFVGEDGSMNLGAAQDNTLKGATITLCPLSFTNPAASANLGSTKPVKDISIETILPRSGTFYHELFHLVLGTADTPDLTYSWEAMQEALKAPDDYPEDDEGGEDEDGDGDVNMGDADDEEEIEEWTNAERIRRNPETYLFFSVGYWYFQQTKWSQNTNQRWSFHNGAGEQVQL